MKNAIIVDIDGTLSNINHRLKYINCPRKEQNWKKFYDLIPDDKPHWDMINLIKVLSKHYAVILLTGRPTKYRQSTVDWLKKQGLSAPFLIMRDDKDNRPGHEFKEEVYEKQLKDKANIVAIFEDELKCVDMWRRKGLRCLQVEEWEERNWKKMCERYAWQVGEYKKNYLEVFKKCDELAAENEKLRREKK